MGRRRRGVLRKGSTEEEKQVTELCENIKRQKRKIDNRNKTHKSLWRQMKLYGLGILFFRLASAAVITTEFVPDEAWQSTEVAYYHTFGKGHLTWEWTFGLRNHIYPFCIAGIYKFLKFFGADSPQCLLMFPRLFQACISSLGDYCFFLYCSKKYGHETARWSLGCLLSCWFTFYCGARTITNTTEMALNCIAMYLMECQQVVAMCGVVALNFLIRPTALVIWIPQLYDIFRLFWPPIVPHRLPGSIFFGLSVLVFGSLLDCKVYGKPVLSWLRFFEFNFLQGHSAEFGVHHPLWYLYSGVPSILLFSVLPLLQSLYIRTHVKEWGIMLTYIFIFSLISHKEIRFLLPLLPYMFAVIGDVLATAHQYVKEKQHQVFTRTGVNIQRLFFNACIVAFTVNLFAFGYFGTFHQGAMIQIAKFTNLATRNIPNPQIWIMMQCYSIPIFTYMHRTNATFEYFTCGPGHLGLDSTLPNFRKFSSNETDLRNFITDKNSTNVAFPDIVLCFDELTNTLTNIFKDFGYEYYLCRIRLHAHFGDDRGSVHALCRKGADFTQIASDPVDLKTHIFQSDL